MLNFIALLAAVIGALVGPQQTESAINAHYYANQTPYGNPQVMPFKAPPAGYEMVFIENVARHGARTLVSSGTERRALQVWKAASKRGALTATGEGFDDDIAEFQKAERKIGYGNMSKLGKQEWAGIGRRTASAYGDYLAAATKNGDQIAYKVTTFQRTEESADAMIKSLKKVVPDLKLAPRLVDKRLLITRGTTIAANHAVNQILATPAVVEASKGVLRELYTPAYVESLKDPVEAAIDVYKLYETAPGMAADTDVTFEQYVPLEHAKVLAYAVDTQNFYGFGPGLAGQDNSYRAARPILADFFAELDDRVNGGSTAAVFRPAHGETIMPFAALIGLPGSEKQATPGEIYTYDNNPWRGYVAGRLAGNIEWVAYRNAAGGVLVTMRYNEQPVEFRAGCTATLPYFYDLAELKRCLG